MSAAMPVALPPGFARPDNLADRVYAWHDACVAAKTPGFAASESQVRVAYLEKQLADWKQAYRDVTNAWYEEMDKNAELESQIAEMVSSQ